jgi:1,4-dihydroxy-2-naphthoate octaprenyltransferase
VATFIPIVAGWVLGVQQGDVHPIRFFWVILGSLIVHLSTNLANDYFDHIQGTDSGEAIGGSRVIQEGKISARTLKKSIILLYSLATIIGVHLIVSLALWWMFPVALFALFSSIFYVAPPIRYGYHGLGEVFAAINMGPVMVVGTYWVIAGLPAWRPFFVSIPIGFMVASILYYQSLPDMETDAAVGKRTLAVKLGRRGAFWGLLLQWFLIYAAIFVLIAVGFLSNLALWSLGTVPLFVHVLFLLKTTEDWVLLDQYGQYIRILYFLNGLCMILALIF